MANQYNVIGGNATPVYVANAETPGGQAPDVALEAGENYVGKVGGPSTSVTITPTIGAGSYVSGDYVGVSGVSTEVPNCARVNGGSFFVIAAVLLDKAKASVAGELWFFDAPVTPPADSAAWSLSDADMAHCLGVIPFSTYYASALNSISQIDSGRFKFQCTALTKSVWCCFVTRGAPAYSTGDLVIRLFISQDL